MCQVVTKPVHKRWAKIVVPWSNVTRTAGVAISTHTGTGFYWLRKVPSDRGDGFVLQKEGGESHLVELSDDGSTCNCKAFRYGKEPCRHVLALQALRNAGAI